MSDAPAAPFAPDVRVSDDVSTLARAARDYVIERAHAAIAARGRFTLALTGGSTPRSLYQLLAKHPELPWDSIELCFGDERRVPPDHPDSNAGMVRETLTGQPFVPPERVHRMRGELPVREAAADYEATLRRLFPDASGSDGFPSFDLLLLGLGPDAHIASLFPRSPALHERRAWVTGNWVDKLGVERITLTYPVLNQAADTLFLVAGADKAAAVREALEGQASYEDAPVRGIRPAAGKLTFLLDRAAAGQLTAR
jgi:6-phosphogluconolactonase